ncbi:MAG: undecaprenyl-diphosphatase [Verrucomicrobia bacterium]|nr:MAG: undecaprenyl-diphosphatase [Verrucomicrobiota bacterium]
MELPHWITAILLGVVEGLTEFLPVSSTGHLLIVEHWLPRQTDLFNVVIQSGAVLAVIPLFRERISLLLQWRSPESRRLWSLIAASFGITAAGGILLEKLHFRLPEATGPVAWALIVGGFIFLLVERLVAQKNLSAEHTWKTAIVVGAAQLVAAAFPGASRSGSTIMASMLAGTSRVTATEFSFLVGIPTLLAASALKLLKAFKSGATENWTMLLLSTLVAAAVSFVTVKWLLRFVQTHSFAAFGVYRIIVGAGLLCFL